MMRKVRLLGEDSLRCKTDCTSLSTSKFAEDVAQLQKTMQIHQHVSKGFQLPEMQQTLKKRYWTLPALCDIARIYFELA